MIGKKWGEIPYRIMGSNFKDKMNVSTWLIQETAGKAAVKE